MTKHDALHPSQDNGWRRQGFGLFFIIAMIKYCYAVDNAAKTVAIFLQCFEPSAFNFYTMLGLIQMNDHYDDGFGMIPRHVRDHLSANIFVFHHFQVGSQRVNDNNVIIPSVVTIDWTVN